MNGSDFDGFLLIPPQPLNSNAALCAFFTLLLLPSGGFFSHCEAMLCGARK